MKICSTCKEFKSELAFYKDKSMNDGLFYQCKECTKKRVRNNYERDLESSRKKERQRWLKRKSNPTEMCRRNKYLKKWRTPLKQRAHNMVRRHIIEKGLLPKICEICGKDANLHAHHYDYNAPLSVIWLCVVCHRHIHTESGRKRNERF